MAKTTLEDFPIDILVDATKSREAIFLHPDQSIFADEPVAAAFEEIDTRYAADREARIRFMAESVHNFSVPGTFGLPAPVDAAYESDEHDAESNEILIVTSPLNDGKPKSSADDMVRFINTPEPSFWEIARSRPNSWGPVTKLDIGFQLNQAMGRPMPMLQLFSRVRPRAMSAQERRLMWQGDYSAFGRIASEGVGYVNELRAQQGKTPITVAHFFGAGMGQRALGAARYMLENQDEIEVGSANAMNLSLRRGVKGTALDHLTQAAINEASGVVIPGGHTRIDEPLQRQDTDRHGSDTLQMYGRQAWAMKDLAATTIPFARKYKPTLEDVETLLANGVPVRLVNGLNVGMAVHTLHLLPLANPLLKLSTIVGTEGQKVTMMSNEHAGAVAVAMSLGIRDYDETRQDS